MRAAPSLLLLLLLGTSCAPVEQVDDSGPAAFVCVSPDDCDDDGTPSARDCDDEDPAVAPGRVEVAGNGQDDDCDPSTPDAERIEVAATSGRIFVEVPADLDGAGSGRVGAIAITASAGTIEVDGETLDAFVDERVPWSSVGYVMQQIIAVGPERIVTLWAYCGGAALSYLYVGDVDNGPLDSEPASGTCAERDEPAFVDVTLPAVSLAIPSVARGFTVEGPAISVRDGEAGGLRTDTRSLTLLPFRIVDCSTDCGSPGWWELHSLLWSSTDHVGAFGIVYLYLDENLDAGRDVSVVTARPLPTLDGSFPDGATFFASVTTP